MSFAMSPLRRAALSVKNSELVRELKVYPGYPAFRAARQSARQSDCASGVQGL